MARVFVYGTLKQGFRNFHVNRGTRLPGAFVTVEAFPLYVIGPFALPWLVHEPGRGERIKGQHVAEAYFGSTARLLTEAIHHGPIAEYTEDHQVLYRRHL